MRETRDQSLEVEVVVLCRRPPAGTKGSSLKGGRDSKHGRDLVVMGKRHGRWGGDSMTGKGKLRDKQTAARLP